MHFQRITLFSLFSRFSRPAASTEADWNTAPWTIPRGIGNSIFQRKLCFRMGESSVFYVFVNFDVAFPTFGGHVATVG